MNKSRIGSVVVAGVIGLMGGQVCIAQPSAAVCDDGGVGKPEICVRFDNLANAPIENTDFRFALGDPDNPGVTLIRGSDGQTTREWRVWSWDDSQTQTPRNLGEITASGQWNYEFRLLQPDGGDGGENLQKINLDPNGATFFSRILDGTINGNLTGDLFLQKSSGGAGGTLDFTVEGDVTGGPLTVTLPVATGLTILGDLVNAVVNINEMGGGTFQIGGGVDRFSVLNITSFGSGATLKIGYLGAPESNVMSGDINVSSDLPGGGATGGIIDMSNAWVDGFSVIDFGSHDINGTLLARVLVGTINARDLAGTIDVTREFSNGGMLTARGMSSTVHSSVRCDSFGMSSYEYVRDGVTHVRAG